MRKLNDINIKRMKRTIVLQDTKEPRIHLSLRGTIEDGEMDLCISSDDTACSFTMNHPDVLYLIEQLLEHNDMTLEDYKVGIESIRRQLPKN